MPVAHYSFCENMGAKSISARLQDMYLPYVLLSLEMSLQGSRNRASHTADAKCECTDKTVGGLTFVNKGRWTSHPRGG